MKKQAKKYRQIAVFKIMSSLVPLFEKFLYKLEAWTNLLNNEKTGTILT